MRKPHRNLIKKRDIDFRMYSRPFSIKKITMQKINKNSENRQTRDFKELYQSVESVLKSIPMPFGSLEKATYVIYAYGGRKIYSFITTCHNTEECVEIMKGKFHALQKVKKYCKVYKIQNGIKALIYADKNIFKD